MGVKRLLLILVLALSASVAIVSDAPAGDFADEPCPDVGGIATCPPGTAGVPYSTTIKLKEGSGCGPGFTTWSVTSGTLPPGLSLNSDGVISGTPTEAGNFDFYITVSYPVLVDPPCNGGFSDKQFRIPINPGVPKLTIGPESAPAGTVNAAYSLPMTANLADAKTWSVSEGALPTGLAIDSATGVISGTPTTAGTYGFTVRAVLADQRSDTKALAITVRDPVAIVAPDLGTSSELAGSEVGVRFNALLSATGGTGTYTWSLTGGALPPGVVLGPTGALEGRPTRAGTYGFTISATDTEGRIATYKGALEVESRLSVVALLLRPGTVGKYYQATLRTSGGVGPMAWRIQRGPLPRGVLFDRNTATFFGTPGRARTYRIGVEVVDALGVKVTKTLVLVVRAAKKLAKRG